jgi:hypothetical protein
MTPSPCEKPESPGSSNRSCAKAGQEGSTCAPPCQTPDGRLHGRRRPFLMPSSCAALGPPRGTPSAAPQMAFVGQEPLRRLPSTATLRTPWGIPMPGPSAAGGGKRPGIEPAGIRTKSRISTSERLGCPLLLGQIAVLHEHKALVLEQADSGGVVLVLLFSRFQGSSFLDLEHLVERARGHRERI